MLTRRNYKLHKITKSIFNMITAVLVIMLVIGAILFGLYILGTHKIAQENITNTSQEILDNAVDVVYDKEYNEFDFSNYNQIETTTYKESISSYNNFVVYFYGNSEVSDEFLKVVDTAIKRADMNITALDLNTVSKSEKKEIESKFEMDGVNPFIFKLSEGNIEARTQNSDIVNMEAWFNHYKYNR